jgi:hypothetical protein
VTNASVSLTRRDFTRAAAALGALTLLAPLGCQRAAGSLSGIALVRAELAPLLDSRRTSFEAGYRTLDDGMKLVASIHHLSKVSGTMLEWWHLLPDLYARETGA